MLKTYNKLPVFVAIISMAISIAHASQRCQLVNQTRDYDGKLTCDYVCDDGTSRVRYCSKPYCPAEIGSN